MRWKYFVSCLHKPFWFGGVKRVDEITHSTQIVHTNTASLNSSTLFPFTWICWWMVQFPWEPPPVWLTSIPTSQCASCDGDALRGRARLLSHFVLALSFSSHVSPPPPAAAYKRAVCCARVSTVARQEAKRVVTPRASLWSSSVSRADGGQWLFLFFFFYPARHQMALAVNNVEKIYFRHNQILFVSQ